MFNPTYSDELAVELKEDRFFKVSDNSHIVDDLEQAIREQEQTIKKLTINREKVGKTPDETMLYKIKGIEFLPSGFLELDPLLFGDEYHFDTDSQFRMF